MNNKLLIGSIIAVAVLVLVSTTSALDVNIFENQPPDAPIIHGPRIARIGIYKCTLKAIDPDGDNVSYEIHWGDHHISNWTNWYPSGEEVTRNHTYKKVMRVLIKARAKDTHGAIGEPGSMDIKISKETTNPLILRVIEQFPLLEVFLRTMNLLR